MENVTYLTGREGSPREHTVGKFSYFTLKYTSPLIVSGDILNSSAENVIVCCMFASVPIGMHSININHNFILVVAFIIPIIL